MIGALNRLQSYSVPKLPEAVQSFRYGLDFASMSFHEPVKVKELKVFLDQYQINYRAVSHGWGEDERIHHIVSRIAKHSEHVAMWFRLGFNIGSAMRIMANSYHREQIISEVREELAEVGMPPEHINVIAHQLRRLSPGTAYDTNGPAGAVAAEAIVERIERFARYTAHFHQP